MTTPRLTSTTYQHIPVIRPTGEYDFTTVAELRIALTNASGIQSRVILDLANLTFADSSVLGLLASSARRARNAGGWLRLVAPPPGMRRVLGVTALDTVLPIYDTIEQAALA